MCLRYPLWRNRMKRRHQMWRRYLYAKHPRLRISPKEPLKFGQQIVSLISPSQTVTLINKSGSFAIPLTNIRVKLPFIKVGTTCTIGVPAGGTCDIEIAFRPTVPGSVELKKGLTITGAFKNTPLTYELKGTGVIGPTPTPTISATATATATPTETATSTATDTATATSTTSNPAPRRRPQPRPTRRPRPPPQRRTATATATNTATEPPPQRRLRPRPAALRRQRRRRRRPRRQLRLQPQRRPRRRPTARRRQRQRRPQLRRDGNFDVNIDAYRYRNFNGTRQHRLRLRLPPRLPPRP